MSMKSQIAALQKAVSAIAPKKDSPFSTPPPEREQFKKADGFIDDSAWRAALDDWSIKEFGEPLAVVAERIAEEEGF